MKKSHVQMLAEAFSGQSWKATLGWLLDDGRYTYAHKLTARISDLRRMGFTIYCEEKALPADNLYVVTPPDDWRKVVYGPRGSACAPSTTTTPPPENKDLQSAVGKGGQREMLFGGSPWMENLEAWMEDRAYRFAHGSDKTR